MSLHLIQVGVGALIAFGSVGVAHSQTLPSGQPQKSPNLTAKSPNLKTIAATFEDKAASMGEPSAIAQIAQTFRDTVPRSQSKPTIAAAPPSLEGAKIVQFFANEPQKAPDPAVAQAPKPVTPPRSTPLPPSNSPTSFPQPPAATPAPGTPVPTPTTSKSDPTPAPAYLNSPANPLLFPTRPDEVRLAGTQLISLLQAIELAERNNRDLQVSRLQLESSRSALREAQANLYPTVGIQSSLARSQSASGDISSRLQAQSPQSQLFGASGAGNPPSTSLTGTVQLSYSIFASGLNSARRRAAERLVRAAELTVEQTREQLRLDTTNDYYNLQSANEQVRINQAAVINAQRSLSDTLAQERAGLGTRFDVLRSQVNLANAQQQLTNAIATQGINRRQLASRLSLPESINVSTSDPVQPAGIWTLPIEDTIVLAYKNRAELEAQLVQREVSEQQRRAALATLGPTVNAVASYNLLKNFETALSAPGSGYSVGLQAQWNFFDGGAAQARAAQQERNKEIAETRFAQSRNTVRFQVEQAYINLQSNRANIDTTTTALSQAAEALRLARLRFQAGVGTQTDVINAETDLTRAEGNRVSAIIGYNLSLAQLQRAVSNIAVR
ncbi:TolC family protein [Phormidesmis priestleyi]|uniref:TolC family protein n=1 Tax=Phormidesmis priestleyi TaxID=268141 RepID=UPI0018D2DF09|nr:TolC family protein [Phormidesmis priestleyi]